MIIERGEYLFFTVCKPKKFKRQSRSKCTDISVKNVNILDIKCIYNQSMNTENIKNPIFLCKLIF